MSSRFAFVFIRGPVYQKVSFTHEAPVTLSDMAKAVRMTCSKSPALINVLSLGASVLKVESDA
jgi:hypothetical protein